MSGAAIYVTPSFSIGNVDSVSKQISARRDRQKGRVWALLLCSLVFFFMIHVYWVTEPRKENTSFFLIPFKRTHRLKHEKFKNLIGLHKYYRFVYAISVLFAD